MAKCEVCFRYCDIPEGGLGFCGARTCADGAVTAGSYGRITSLALDPIEKKPLSDYYPGSRIISVGSFGCNLSSFAPIPDSTTGTFQNHLLL